MKPFKLKSLFILLFLSLALFSCSSSDDSTSSESESESTSSTSTPVTTNDTKKPCEDTNCANYRNREEAQRDYELHPECRADLDRDKDGVACEEPGNSTKDCYTTSNCGCSGKTKAECGTSICCKWIVGTGCKCS